MASNQLQHASRNRLPPESQLMLGDDNEDATPLKVLDGPGSHELGKLCPEKSSLPNESNTAGSRCGLGHCTPNWAQKFANLPLFATYYGLAGIWMSAAGPLLSSQITSIERHLGLSTSQTGLIMSANDIGYLMVVMVASHMGKRLHIPRTLCVSAIIFGLTCFAMAMGKFTEIRAESEIDQNVNNKSTEDSQHQYLCQTPKSWDINTLTSSRNVSSLNVNTRYSSPNIESASNHPYTALPWAFWLLACSAVVGGMVKSYRVPLFTYYVETNVKDRSRSALFIGASFTAMIFGPPLALLLGAFISTFHVDLKEATMSQLDQRWVGAWWLGFIVVGAACIIFALPVMCFPRHMSGQERVTEDEKAILSIKQIMADLPRSLKRIFKRPIFVLTLCACVVEAFCISGAFAFIQKYMEVQFNKTPRQVSMGLGILIIFSLASGTFLGGLVTTRLKMGLRGCVIAALLRSSVLVVFQCLYFIFGCNNTQFTEPMPKESCQCDGDTVLFGCGNDQLNYISPCIAGCSNKTESLFTNCSGINDGIQQVTPGLCEDGCPYFLYFLVTNGILSFIGCMGIIPGYIQIMRTIEQTDQALALGTVAFCQTLLGTLPSPVVFGKLIDSTCEIWSPVGGHCLLYDKEAIRLWFHGLAQTIRLGHIAIIAVILWLVVKKNLGSTYSERDRNERKNATK